mmetsp:Transcript_10464/g.22761  ORF Transcript_10464/g.22761 Transcript_10464/m.22761 type:complete len:216 (+) Transcript_10464:514-1161(+)
MRADACKLPARYAHDAPAAGRTQHQAALNRGPDAAHRTPRRGRDKAASIARAPHAYARNGRAVPSRRASLALRIAAPRASSLSHSKAPPSSEARPRPAFLHGFNLVAEIPRSVKANPALGFGLVKARFRLRSAERPALDHGSATLVLPLPVDGGGDNRLGCRLRRSLGEPLAAKGGEVQGRLRGGSEGCERVVRHFPRAAAVPVADGVRSGHGGA